MTRGFREFDLVEDARRIGSLQAPLLQATMQRIALRHPFYRREMQRLDLSPDDFTALDTLEDFPLTEKHQLVEEPEAFRLDPDPSRPAEYALWDVAYTTGTSLGRPTAMYQTAYDFRALTIAQRRMAEIRGMGHGGRIVNLYPITSIPHGAWIRCNQAAAAIGASVTAGMSGRAVDGFRIVRATDEVASITVGTDPTVLWGVPSYVRRVLQEIVAIGRHLPSLHMIAVSGEPCGPAMRKSLADLAGQAGAGAGVVVSDSMGATELQCGLVESAEGAGFHNPAPELFHFAAVDDRGLSVPDGEVGRLVLTHLDRRGTVLVRFWLGDLVTFTDEPCARCGHGGGLITEHRGRGGSFMKIRGNLVDIGAVSNAVGVLPHVVEHQLIIRRPEADPMGLDELVIRIVTDTDEPQSVSRDVATAVGAEREHVPPDRVRRHRCDLVGRTRHEAFAASSTGGPMTDPGAIATLEIPQEQLDAIQLDRLKASLGIAADHHPYYRERLREVDFERWTTLAHLDALAVTTKATLAAEPEAFRLRDASGEPHQMWDVIYTSGTTSDPIPIYQTPHDHRRILFAQRRMAAIRGTSSTDTIANLFPLAGRGPTVPGSESTTMPSPSVRGWWPGLGGPIPVRTAPPVASARSRGSSPLPNQRCCGALDPTCDDSSRPVSRMIWHSRQSGWWSRVARRSRRRSSRASSMVYKHLELPNPP